jgi:hypothetical protein
MTSGETISDHKVFEKLSEVPKFATGAPQRVIGILSITMFSVASHGRR